MATAAIIFLLLLLVVSVPTAFVLGVQVTQKRLPYKKRWQEAVAQLERQTFGEEEPESDVVNGWTIKKVVINGHYTSKPNVKVDFIQFQLVKGKEVVKVFPALRNLGLDPGHVDFPQQIKAYRKKVIDTAKLL